MVTYEVRVLLSIDSGIGARAVELSTLIGSVRMTGSISISFPCWIAISFASREINMALKYTTDLWCKAQLGYKRGSSDDERPVKENRQR